MKEIVVLTTADSDELARKIAWALVEAGEAACVNIIPGIRSIYRWQDKVVDEGEILLFIKSSEDRFDAIRSRIRSLHPYQVPEVISIPIIAGDEEYLHWLQDQIKAEGGRQ